MLNRTKKSSDLAEPLTRREKDILELLGQDLADREIAERLTLALSSVKWYTRQIYAKLEVENRHSAVSRAKELGLLTQAALSNPAHNLPRQLTRFIGHEKEIAKTVEMVWEYPLVTLTGSGGVGKTRLALKVAEELLDDFSDGVWFVELAALNDPHLVPRILADALGMSEDPLRPLFDQLIFFLRDRQALIVFDDCEHLLDVCSNLIGDLLKALPRLKVLISSREPLGVQGEAILRVPSLSFPLEGQEYKVEEMLQFESVRLFLERARAVRPEFQLVFENSAAVAHICQRLDGIPLAIELAAARLDSLDVRQIAERLNQAFRLLSGGSRNALPRQQTLRASIDWSYNLLTQPERLLFLRLAVFAGGWTLESAETICGFEGLTPDMIVDIQTSLVRKSLVVSMLVPGTRPRYCLLETIRQYALEQLSDQAASTALRRRHQAVFLHLVEKAAEYLRGPSQISWYEILESELDNLRAAMEWTLQDPEAGRAEDGLRLICGLTSLWVKNGLANEGLAWLERSRGLFRDTKSIPPDLSTLADRSAGAMYNALSQYTLANRTYEIGAEHSRALGDTHGLIESLIGLSFLFQTDLTNLNSALRKVEEGLSLARQYGTQWEVAAMLRNKSDILVYSDAAESLRCGHESAVIFESLGDKMALIGPSINFGQIAIRQGEYSRARAILLKTLDVCRETKSRNELCFISSLLGDTAYLEGQYADMETYFQESLTLSRETGFLIGYIWSLHHLGVASRRLGQVDRAARFFYDSFSYARDYNCDNMVYECIAGAAGIAFETCQPEKAVRLLAAMEAVFFPLRDCLLITIGEMARDKGALCSCLGEARFLAVWAEGKEMTIRQAEDSSLEIFNDVCSGQPTLSSAPGTSGH